MKLALPDKFTNKYEDWQDWSWKFRMFMGLYEPDLEPLLIVCESINREITDVDLPGADEEQKALCKKYCRKIHYLLVQLTSGRAQLIVRNNNKGNGLESFRLLSKSFNLPSNSQSLGLLMQLQNFVMNASTFEADLQRFDSLKSQYERISSNKISNDQLQALIFTKTQCLPELHAHLRLHANELGDYSKLKQTVEQYLASRHITEQLNSGPPPTPMDVGAMNAMKGKRNDKGCL